MPCSGVWIPVELPWQRVELDLCFASYVGTGSGSGIYSAGGADGTPEMFASSAQQLRRARLRTSTAILLQLPVGTALGRWMSLLPSSLSPCDWKTRTFETWWYIMISFLFLGRQWFLTNGYTIKDNLWLLQRSSSAPSWIWCVDCWDGVVCIPSTSD